MTESRLFELDQGGYETCETLSEESVAATFEALMGLCEIFEGLQIFTGKSRPGSVADKGSDPLSNSVRLPSQQGSS